MADPQTVVLTVAPLQPVPTADRLKGLPRRTVLFPPCAQEILSLIRTTGVPDTQKDDVTKLFDDYFKFGQRHQVLAGDPGSEVDPKLRECMAPPAGEGASPARGGAQADRGDSTTLGRDSKGGVRTDASGQGLYISWTNCE